MRLKSSTEHISRQELNIPEDRGTADCLAGLRWHVLLATAGSAEAAQCWAVARWLSGYCDLHSRRALAGLSESPSQEAEVAAAPTTCSACCGPCSNVFRTYRTCHTKIMTTFAQIWMAIQHTSALDLGKKKNFLPRKTDSLKKPE